MIGSERLDRALAVIDAHAEVSADHGRLDDAIVAALAGTGMNRSLLPTALGGDQMNPSVLCDTVSLIGTVDGSTAWCSAISAGSGLFAGYVPEAGSREMFADPDKGSAGMFAPVGIARRDALGSSVATLAGRWPFASNCLHARWIGLGAFVEDADGTREPFPRLVFVPVDALEIEPTWQSAGLRATGSHHVRADDVSIDLGHSCTFGDRPWADGPLWSVPLFSVLGPVLVAAPMGVARGAVDRVLGMVRDGASAMRGSLADDAVGLAELAAADSALRAAEAGLRRASDSVWEIAERGDRPSRQLQAQVFLAVHHGLDTAVESTSIAHRLCGGSAAYQGHRLLVALADVHAARQHIMFAHQHRPGLVRISAGIDEVAPPFVF